MNEHQPKRILITGGPGSGKTWLAARIAKTLGVDVIDLDGRGLKIVEGTVQVTPEDFDEVVKKRDADLELATAAETWVCEGSFVGFESWHLQRAELIVWMDAPWCIASYRILSRHVKLTLQRRNRFPGWLRMITFWRWSERYYRDTNPPGLNPWGSPATNAHIAAVLSKYGARVLHVRTRREVLYLRRRFGV